MVHEIANICLVQLLKGQSAIRSLVLIFAHAKFQNAKHVIFAQQIEILSLHQTTVKHESTKNYMDGTLRSSTADCIQLKTMTFQAARFKPKQIMSIEIDTKRLSESERNATTSFISLLYPPRTVQIRIVEIVTISDRGKNLPGIRTVIKQYEKSWTER